MCWQQPGCGLWSCCLCILPGKEMVGALSPQLPISIWSFYYSFPACQGLKVLQWEVKAHVFFSTPTEIHFDIFMLPQFEVYLFWKIGSLCIISKLLYDPNIAVTFLFSIFFYVIPFLKLQTLNVLAMNWLNLRAR